MDEIHKALHQRNNACVKTASFMTTDDVGQARLSLQSKTTSKRAGEMCLANEHV